MPAVAYLHPQRVSAAAGDEVTLRLTVVSDCTDASLTGRVALRCPAGWKARPAELPYTLEPGDYRETDVRVAIPPRAEAGLYPLRAQLHVTGDDVPAAWRQVVEDVCVVAVGGVDGRLVSLVGEPSDVEVSAGDSARLVVTVGTEACADLALEAHLISPWDTWEWTGPAAQGAVLPARGAVELGFDIAPPAWAEPGEWWALVRLACAGHLLYSPAVRVAVR